MRPVRSSSAAGGFGEHLGERRTRARPAAQDDDNGHRRGTVSTVRGRSRHRSAPTDVTRDSIWSSTPRCSSCDRALPGKPGCRNVGERLLTAVRRAALAPTTGSIDRKLATGAFESPAHGTWAGDSPRPVRPRGPRLTIVSHALRCASIGCGSRPSRTHRGIAPGRSSSRVVEASSSPARTAAKSFVSEVALARTGPQRSGCRTASSLLFAGRPGGANHYPGVSRSKGRDLA